jgi:putative flippase GtrA
VPFPDLSRHSPMIGQAARFAMVGAVNTLVDVGLFAIFFYVLAWPLLLANAGGFTVAVCLSYVLNKTWTFADRSRGRQAIRRGFAFAAVALGGLAIGSLAIWLAAFALSPILAKLASVGATFLWNFTVSRRWVFRD